MKTMVRSKGFVGLAVLAALPCLGSADTFMLRRDDVIPVTFEDKLTVRDNRPGDMFTVRVGNTDELPRGTEILGRIDRIHPARGNRPASMDLRFTSLLLPDRSRIAIDAAPLPLDDKYITRTGDGRIIAKQDIRSQQADVIGGAIGGFIVGSIFHRRFTGAVIGTIIGIGAAENQRASDSNVVVNAGDRVGALINHDVVIDFGQAAPPSRYGINPNLDRGMADPATGYAHSAISYDNIHITFRRNDLTFPEDARPYRIGRDVMVPLEPVADQLSLDVDRRKDRTVYVDGPDLNLRLTIDSRQARLDGRRYDLPRTVVEQNGVIYVPLAALTPLLKDDLFLNGNKFVGLDH